MKLYKLSDRPKLYFKIHTYGKRKEKLREKHNVVIGQKSSEKYWRDVENINRKIDLWRIGIRNIDKKREILSILQFRVEKFTGAKLRDEAEEYKKKTIVRQLFCKYALENRISASLVAEYIHRHVHSVQNMRRNFTKLIVNKPEKRAIWDRFKIYIKDLECKG